MNSFFLPLFINMVTSEDNENECNQNGFNLEVCDPREKQKLIR